MELLLKHTWILFIAVTLLNGLLLKSRSKPFIAEQPELEKGYNDFFKGWMVFGNIPWVIMMFGALSGATQSTFDYLNPKALNPVVLSFYSSIVLLWILSIRWIYFRKGAEFIERHPGLIRISSLKGTSYATARQVKLFFPVIILGGIIGMIVLWSMTFSNSI